MQVTVPAKYITERFLLVDPTEVGTTALETINKAARLATFASKASGDKATISLTADEALLFDVYTPELPMKPAPKARRTKGAS